MQSYNINKKICNVLLCILISVAISGCVSSPQDGTLYDGPLITAMEGYTIANDTAINWSVNATLIEIVSGIGNIKNGYSSWWGYHFWNGSYGSDTVLMVYIYGNGIINIRYRSFSSPGLYHPVNNWTIDSDEAYNIAINNTEISDYLNNTRNRAKISLFSLYGLENSTGEWHILWDFGQSHIKIEIDASTGEVLYTGPMR